MRAAVLHAVGDSKVDIRDDVRLGEVGPHDVRVAMRAAGICHTDVSVVSGALPAMMPAVLGHEGAGVVVEVGANVTEPAVGDHVILFAVPPCGSCPACRRGQPHLCAVHVMEAFTTPHFQLADAGLFGFSGCGTFAEEVIVPAVGAVKVDDDVPFDVAALIGCGVMTGAGAVFNTAGVEPGSTVVVIGCGGVGFAVLQAARISGATTIVAVDLVAEKLELARRFGATHACSPDGLADLTAELTGGQGYDYAFEVVGAGATIRAAYDATRRGGTTVVVGAGRVEDMVEFSAFELFAMERRLLGSFLGSADIHRDFAKLAAMWRSGQLDIEGMISSRLRLEDVNEGLHALQGGTVIRQVVTFD